MKRREIYIFIFFLALAEALLFSVNSPFIAGLISEELVGAVYSLSSMAAILLLGLLPFFISRTSPRAVLSTLLVAGAVVSFIVAYFPSVSVLGALVIFLAIPQVAPAVSDIFIEGLSRVRERGKVIGTEFSFMNLAFVIGPVIAGLVIWNFGFGILYGLSGATFILALLLSLRFSGSIKPRRLHPGNLWRGMRLAWRRADLRFVLFCQFILQLFFSWMVIYTPLYLIDKFNFSYQALGVIFSLMLLPYVLLEYPLGRIADERLGEKELLSGGFVLMAITTSVMPLISSASLAIWALLLFGTRVGAAMVEGMSATYFYKKVNASDIDLIAIFRDMRPVAYIIGPLSAVLMLSKISMGALFPILGILLVAGSLLATRLHDTR